MSKKRCYIINVTNIELIFKYIFNGKFWYWNIFDDEDSQVGALIRITNIAMIQFVIGIISLAFFRL